MDEFPNLSQSPDSELIKCLWMSLPDIYICHTGTLPIRDKRTRQGSTKRRVGAIFFGFNWFWCAAVLRFQNFLVSADSSTVVAPNGSGSWVPGTKVR